MLEAVSWIKAGLCSIFSFSLSLFLLLRGSEQGWVYIYIYGPSSVFGYWVSPEDEEVFSLDQLTGPHCWFCFVPQTIVQNTQPSWSP